MHLQSHIEGQQSRADTGATGAPADAVVTPAAPVPQGLGSPGHWQLDEPYGHAERTTNVDLAQSSLWAVPWSDLMMVMFVLFASLLIMQQRDDASDPVETPVPEAVATPEPEPVTEYQEREVERPDEVPRRGPSLEPLTQLEVLGQSEAAVREAGIENVEVALTSNQSVKVSVQGPMFFELGKAELRPEVRDFLDRLAEVIADTPFEIDVIGHTDDQPVRTGEFPSNWELSVVRAARVARYLIERSGVAPGRFTAMGRSMFEPAVPNLDDDSRALNRRVEIIITRRQSPNTE